MNKVLIALIAVIFTFCYLAWPIYQALAYKDMVPMVIKASLKKPNETPVNSLVFNPNVQKVAEQAIEALSKQTAYVQAPGYTAAVAIENELVWSGSAGWADIENQIAMTPNTKFRVGSTSKAITSAGLAKLVESNKIGLDVPLSKYFSKLPNSKWKNITARQLASHMAGLPHYGDNTELFGKLAILKANQHYYDVNDAVSLFDESELLFSPGENFSYSSLGTILLSALIQKQAGERFQTFMQNNIFTKLNMFDTTYEQPNKKIENLAQFYWRQHDHPNFYKPWIDVDLSHRLAGGGWVSTSQDLVKLGQAFMDENFLTSEVKELFWTPQKLNNGEVNSQGYGIGWRIHALDLGSDFEELIYVHHGGVTAGAQSFLMVLPKYKMSIAVNANIKTQRFSKFNEISYTLAKLFLKEIIRTKNCSRSMRQK